MKRCDEAVWSVLDPDATWPTLPENLNPEYGGPERYFDDCMKVEIGHACQALDAIEKACW
ncbi:MAG: hypothetical protein V4793_09115 [Paraburkholderia tropica]|uniref:hypothetical protein n=1 Tax=Paraburkholderia tropica TaxID=92647 RepID=UPI0031015B48